MPFLFDNLIPTHNHENNYITYRLFYRAHLIQDDTKKRELLKNPRKIEEIQEKNLLTEIEPLQHTQNDTKERELLKCVVAVKECIRGGGRHLQDVIFKH